jgi:integrase
MALNDYSRWYKIPDKKSKSGFALRRYHKVDGKTLWERYPAKLYRNLSEPEIDSLLNKLNATHYATIARRDEMFNYKLAYINQSAVVKFEEFLMSQANSKHHVGALLNYLNTYGFQYFINLKQINDPAQWYLAESNWGQWLIAQGLAANTIKQIVAVVNRFLEFIQRKVYTDMPAVRKLAPIGRNKLKRMQLDASKKTAFITDATWQKIVDWFKRHDPDVLPNVLLAEAYGLRLAESQGLDKTKFFHAYLLVNEQGERILNGSIKRAPIKTNDERKVPHWNVDARKAWEWVKQVKPMHPDTLNRRVNAGFAVFGHGSHDMRRRFITKALRQHSPRDVQAAAGHKNIVTTMQYAQDDRELQDKMLDLE